MSYYRLLNIQYNVCEISPHLAIEFLKEHHEKHSCCSNISDCYGFFVEKSGGLFGTESELLGVITFRKPWNKKVSSGVFGSEYANDVLEIHRVKIKYNTICDYTGYELLIVESIKQLYKKHQNLKGIVAHTADLSIGTILSVDANFSRCGDKGLVKYVKLLYSNEEEHKELVRMCRIKQVVEKESAKLTYVRYDEIDDFLRKLGDVWKKKDSNLQFGQLVSKVFSQNLPNKDEEEIIKELWSF